MENATPRATAPWRSVFADTLGRRYHGSGTAGEPLEAFELRAELGANAAFEAALRQRMTALASFHHASFPRVRMVQRAERPDAPLVAISERLPGTRLSTILAVARHNRLTLDAGAALYVVRQLLAAITVLHEKQPAFAHGAIAPERIVITPDDRVAVVDHMLGSALETLHYTRDRYWNELRLPSSAAAPAVFDPRSDVMQIGVTTLTLLLGRPIEPAEWPDGIAALAKQACESTAVASTPFRDGLHTWLRRMLQLPGEEGIACAGEALTDLDWVLASNEDIASANALASFMAAYAQSPALDTQVQSEAGRTSVVKPAPTAAPASPAPEPSPEATSQPPAAAALPRRSAEPRAGLAGSPNVTGSPNSVAVRPTTAGLRHWRWAAAALVAIATSAALLGRPSLSLMPSAGAEAAGTLVVNTDPPGAPVIVDGTARGVTPLTMDLPPGGHELSIVGVDGETRVIPLNIVAGNTVAQTIELSNKSAARTGVLIVRSEPSGARVLIDGAPLGITPFTLDGLTPGMHTVTLRSDAGSATQNVVVEAGKSASLFVPLGPPQGVPVSGWISLSAPAEVQVYEHGRLLGTSQSDRIMVSAGDHEFEIVNEALGYRSTRSVTVAPGKVAAIALDWPKGSLAVNAQPWAEVWINGESIGETPIGKVTLPIGWHEVVFRHPQLGEQKVRAMVTGAAPARVSVDMSKRP